MKLLADLIAAAAFFGGLTAAVYGVSLWSPAAAFVLGGVVLAVLAVAYTRHSTRPEADE